MVPAQKKAFSRTSSGKVSSPGPPTGASRPKPHASFLDRVRQEYTSLLFADPEQYDKSWPRTRLRAALIVDSPWFQFATVFVILVHFVFVLKDIDLAATDPDVYPWWMEAASMVFRVFFVVDVAGNVYAHRSEYFTHPVNVLDFAILLADLVAAAVGLVFQDMAKTSYFALLRMIRLLRILRSAKIVLQFPSLYQIVDGIGHAGRGVLWAMLLITIMLLLCSCVAVVVIHPLNVELAELGVYDGCERCPRAFASVWNSYLTFFQQIIAGDSWGLVTLPIMEAHPWTGAFFIPTIIFIQLGLVNLILAIIVSRAQEARDANYAMLAAEKELELTKMKEDLHAVCAQLDEDKSGTLTVDELLDEFDKPGQFKDIMQVMDIDKDDMRMVFQTLDQDRSGTVTYDEFVYNLYRMKSQDSHTLLVFIKACVTDMRWHMQTKLDETTDKITSQLLTSRSSSLLLTQPSDSPVLAKAVSLEAPALPIVHCTQTIHRELSALLKEASQKVDKQFQVLSGFLPNEPVATSPMTDGGSTCASPGQKKETSIEVPESAGTVSNSFAGMTDGMNSAQMLSLLRGASSSDRVDQASKRVATPQPTPTMSGWGSLGCKGSLCEGVVASKRV